MVVGDSGGMGDTDNLLRRYRETGDLGARLRLIERHLPLVRVLARRHANRGEGYEDLVQVGSIGLIQAIDRFDPDRGADFASFAVPTIAGEIKNHLRDKTTVVRIPRRAADLNARVRREQASLTARLRRAPTLSELACALEIGEDDAADAIETERSRVTFPLTAVEADGTAATAVVDDDPFETCDDRLLLAAGFRTLDARQRRILHLRFYAGLSQAEIAREVGLSQIQVSRVIRASLDRMRGALGRTSSVSPVEKPLARL
jgi:RNA polymerase sigma-B factor